MQEEKVREALNAHCKHRRPAISTQNMIFTMTMPSVTIPSQGNEFWGE